MQRMPPVWTAQPPPGKRSRSSVVALFDMTEIDAPTAEQIAIDLEGNHVVHFPLSPVPLPDAQTLQHFREVLPPRLGSRHVSWHFRRQRLSGLKADAQTCRRTARALGDHLAAVVSFLRRVMPQLCEGWTVASTTLRPFQERGRNLEPHLSDELVHVDGGSYGATHGDRILRFFVNINEQEDRVWASKGPLQDVLDRHGIGAGLLDRTGRLQVKIEESTADRALCFAGRALGLASSPYDRAMRRLHNFMKESESFKSDRRGYEEIRFAPGSAWMAFTDGVSHAVLSGQLALVTTIIIRKAVLRQPHFAPYNLLVVRN